MVNGSLCLSAVKLRSDTNGEKPKQVLEEQITRVLRFLQLLQQGIFHYSKQLVAGEVEGNVLRLIHCEETNGSVVQCCIKRRNSVNVVYTQIVIPISYNVYLTP
jgi:hypothetical protein